MRNIINLLDINLHLFDGAAGGAGAPSGDGAAQGDAGNLPKAENNRRGGSRRRSGEFDNVVFGKQGDASAAADNTPAAGENGQGKAAKSGVETTSNTLEAKRQAFRELIEGEYKDQYTEEFQKSFNRRFKEDKAKEQTIAAQQPIIDMLMQRHNITDGDMGKLQAAIEQDNTYWEEAAEKAGMSVEQFKRMQKLERESAELQAIRKRQAVDQMAQQKYNAWFSEAEKLKETYPGFDFRAELRNKDFTDLLQKGVSVERAYKVVHMEEIEENAAKAAAQITGQQMMAKMQSKASRPQENGTSSQSAVITKSDVHSLTKKERAEAARRAMRGEIQKF